MPVPGGAVGEDRVVRPAVILEVGLLVADDTCRHQADRSGDRCLDDGALPDPLAPPVWAGDPDVDRDDPAHWYSGRVDPAGDRLAGEVSPNVGRRPPRALVDRAGDHRRVVRRPEHVGEVEEGCLGAEAMPAERLVPPGVDPHPELGVGAGMLVEGVLVEDRPPRHVHEDGVGLHGGEFGGADEIAGGRDVREGEDDDVGVAEDCGEIGERRRPEDGVVGAPARVDGDDVDAEGPE